MTFGILTLATHADYHKAIGLALSARVSNPGVPLAVACSPEIKPLLAPYFDWVVMEDPGVRGFAHKLNLDRYSPFDRTFFFDSDVLLFRPLSEVLSLWSGRSYTACGDYINATVAETSPIYRFSPFGLDNAKVLKAINRDRLVHIDGAGHAYFEKPACSKVFDLARTIAADYPHYAGKIRLADEDVMNIAMTLLDLNPMPHFGFWSLYASVKKGTLEMDATSGKCKMIWADTGEVCNPYMMHFLANQAPFLHTRQMRKLFLQYGVSTEGLLRKALHDFYVMNISWPLRSIVRSVINRNQGGAP